MPCQDPHAADESSREDVSMNGPNSAAVRSEGRRTIGCLWIAGILVGIFCLLGGLALLGYRSAQTRRVEAALAEIRQRGEPVDARDLAERHALPPGKSDLTDLWLSAIVQLDTPAFRNAGDLPIVGTGQDPPAPGQNWPQLATVEQLLQDHADALAMLHRAASQDGQVRYPLDFSQGLTLSLEHVQRLRNAARVLALQAHVRAHRGDVAGVAQCIQSIQRLAETLREEPTMVSQLVRIAVNGVAADLVEKMLPQMDFSDEDLRRLSAGMQAIRYEDQLKPVLQCERVIGIMAFRDPSALSDSGVAVPPALSFLRDADLHKYLSVMEQAILIADTPFPQLRSDFQAWREQVTSETRGDPRTIAR